MTPTPSRAANEVVLLARGITKTFVDGELATSVLRGADVQLHAGELVALMGPSGSGKSTLLNILGTLLRPTSGRLVVVGRDVSDESQAVLTQVRNRHIGFVFQFHHLLPDFTATENVLFPSFPTTGKPTAAGRRRAHELLARVGLSDRMDYRPGQLSGGQKQRVAVARAIMMRPQVVLADEPTGNLDRETSRYVIDLLHGVRREEGTAFLVCTHDPDIAGSADRSLHIVDGRIR